MALKRASYKDVAADPRILGFDMSELDAGKRRDIGELIAEDGSVTMWSVVPADNKGYLIEVTLVEGELLENGAHSELDNNDKSPVLFVPLKPVPDGLNIDEDYIPTVYDTVENAYAAFLEVVYADDEDADDLVPVCLSNETTASGFYYKVSKPVLAVLNRLSELELSALMPAVEPCEPGESERYAEALKVKCLNEGLPAASVSVVPMELPSFWFDSGWKTDAVCAHDIEDTRFPDEVILPAGSIADADGEWEHAQALTGILPEGAEAWGFGLVSCEDKLLVSTVETREERDVSIDDDTFACYVVADDGTKLIRFGEPAVGEKSLPSEALGHKVIWNPELDVLEEKFSKVFR